jgi:hypothetical protein
MRAGIVLAILIGTASTALASDLGPVIVIPGRPGMPVIINGADASYTVVDGAWGLGKGIQVLPPGPYVDPEPQVGHYYPSSGHVPGYGRLEIEPPPSRVLPKPAESYHQSWSARSMPQPVQPESQQSQMQQPQMQQSQMQHPQMQSEVPPYPPPVIAAPRNGDAGMSQDPARGPQHQKPRRSLN